MANCDEGYNCDRCGEYVENVQVSELYLRYVLGLVPIEELPREPERHIRCAPEFAQFIVDDDFESVACDDAALDKRTLPADVVARQERIFTQAWRRLQEVRDLQIPVDEYPLAREVLEGR
ncbi:MAG: hypothetical protein OER88_00405 [Planctomycetota bacterium]|nr:hypothetical protein [Planctomycetota bacterium]